MKGKEKNIKIAVTALFILANLIIFKLFPVEGLFQNVIILLIFFVINPFLFNKLVLKEDHHVFGLGIGDWRKGVIWSGWSLLAAGLILYITANFSGFLDNYNIPKRASEDFAYFVYYEMFLVLGLVFIYEFFFRGFIMFQFSKWMGIWAILLQAVVFWILIALNSEFSWNFFPYIVFALFAGFIAYKSKSIVYSLISQSLLIFMIDVFFIRLSL